MQPTSTPAKTISSASYDEFSLSSPRIASGKRSAIKAFDGWDLRFFIDNWNQTAKLCFLSLGLPCPMSSVDNSVEPMSISDRRIGFAGKLAGMNRKELKALIRERGGIYCEISDPQIELIVIGEDGSTLDEFRQQHPELAKRQHLGTLMMLTETEFWQSLGLVDQDHGARRLYTPAMLAELLKVPIKTIRRWHQRGLIKPTRRVHKLPYFDFQEVASARKLAMLVSSGASQSAIESKLQQLIDQFPDSQRPFSQLSIIVEGRDVLLREGDGLIEPGGQQRFDFDSSQEQADLSVDESLLAFEPARIDRDIENLTSPDDFLELAADLEDQDEIESACEVYRSMMLAFGSTADACFRLAENLFQLGELDAARERYYSAIELDQHFVEARASLGCVLAELGKPELAISAFEGALEHHPEYADVMYHLAQQLDAVGRVEEAAVHWQNFLNLAPKSPWADEARDRLGVH